MPSRKEHAIKERAPRYVSCASKKSLPIPYEVMHVIFVACHQGKSPSGGWGGGGMETLPTTFSYVVMHVIFVTIVPALLDRYILPCFYTLLSPLYTFFDISLVYVNRVPSTGQIWISPTLSIFTCSTDGTFSICQSLKCIFEDVE